ncbi:MAG: DUF1624 domain-containing protein [Bacteriovoracaceae bacterium]|nr:DUF1624 domain-containing protein [Bacteriovoracaceae bacterium]
MKTTSRSLLLDTIRGVAVVLMLFFHFSYDLWLFKLADISINNFFWFYLPRLIVFLFLFSVGVSLWTVHTPKRNDKKIWQRFFKLSGLAIVISVSTYVMFPKTWIYLGTIHCIALCSLIMSYLVPYRKILIALIIFILATYFAFDLTTSKLAFIPHVKSMDFIPVYPWIWVVALGILLAPLVMQVKGKPNPVLRILSFLSRHSLKIYLLHQPLFYGVLWVIVANSSTK